MHAQGVDAFAVQNIATHPRQMKNVNDFAASIQCEHIYPFGSVHPDAPDALEELERIAAMGMRGIKLHPDYQDFFVDDPKMFPIYKKASQLGFVILFHAGEDFGYRAPFHCTPERLATALRHIDCPVIAAHWGGACMGEEVLRHLCGLPLYFDLSFGYGTKPRAQALDIIEKHGTHPVSYTHLDVYKRQLLALYDLPTQCGFAPAQLAQAALSDKKRAGDSITLIVPEEIGRCVPYKIPISHLEDFFWAGMEQE